LGREVNIRLYRGSAGGPNTAVVFTGALDHDWRVPRSPCWSSAEAGCLPEHAWKWPCIFELK